MKFCQDHWDRLREAIKERGLGEYIAEGGHEAASRMAGQVDARKVTKANFEPLMGAHNAILSNAMGLVGLEVFADGAGGPHLCPICYLNETHARECKDPKCTLGPTGFDAWIDYAADGQAKLLESLSTIE